MAKLILMLSLICLSNQTFCGWFFKKNKVKLVPRCSTPSSQEKVVSPDGCVSIQRLIVPLPLSYVTSYTMTKVAGETTCVTKKVQLDDSDASHFTAITYDKTGGCYTIENPFMMFAAVEKAFNNGGKF